jgi:hypothetical protein
MKIILLLLVAVLAGCASPPPPPQVVFSPSSGAFDPLEVSKRIVSSGTYVRWNTVDDVDALCRRVIKQSPGKGKVISACATWTWTVSNIAVCTIYTEKRTSHEILGHELRHCFEGEFHK